MPEPRFSDVLDEQVTLDDTEAANVICKLASAMAAAAYWQGVAEERQEQINALSEDRQLTIRYLKDRLDKAESRPNEGGSRA